MSIIDLAFYKFRYSNISILIILGKAISAYIFHKKFIFLTLVFVLFFKCISGFAFAQTVRLFDGQAGVENATINGFAQDTDGFLYVGTETGLYVSSGGEFTRVDNGNAGTFTHVTALAGGEDDNLLIAADHTVWLRNKQSFHKIPLKFQDHLHFSALDKDFIVLAGEGPAKGGGLWRIHPKSGSEPVVERFIDGSINGIRLPKSTIATKPLYAIASSEQTVWLACGDAICRYKDGVSIVFGLHEGVPADKWLALIPDKNKGLIARSTTRIVHINTDKSVELENVPGMFPGTSTYNPFLISTAGGQVITQGASTLFIRSLAGQWESSDFLSKYKSGLISVAFVDREDGIWFARSDHGIMRVAGFAEWKNYGADQGFPAAMVSAVKRDNSGALWLATDKGIFRYASLKENGGRLAEFNHYDINATSLLRAGDGTIWAAGKTSFLIHIDPITKKITSLASQVPLTGAMALDSADRLWIGTAQGLIRIDDPVHPPARLPEILGLNERRINALRFDQYGRLLILTDSVLFRQKSGTDYFEPRVDLLDLGIGEGRSMAVTMSNEIWIAGLIGGIRQITLPEEGNAVISSLFTGSQHIEQVTSIFRDSRGWMWVGSNHGVNVLRSNGWRHFDIDSGLISNQIIQGSVSENDDGSLWLGTDIGFSHLDTELIAPSLPDIHTVILSAYMGSIDLRDKPHVWPENKRKLQISFVAPTFLENSGIKYKYILKGIDSEYHIQNSESVFYQNIKGREVHFNVQAIDPIDGRIANSAYLISYMGGELAYSSRFVGWIAIGVIIISMASMEFYRRYNFIRKTKIDRAVHDRTRVMEEVQKQLRQQSRIDSLTGLLNRRAVLDELSYLMSALIPDELIAVALIDIDHFKHINDTFGHQGGDFVLEQYGLRLRQACDSRVAAGRYGGEELILVFSTVKIRNNIIEKMNSIHLNLVDPILFGKDDISATCSVGLAFFSAGDTSSSLVGRADRALYKGKRNGRNCIVVAD